MSTPLVRPPTMAGRCYPAAPGTLRQWVTASLRRAQCRQHPPMHRPRAIVAPHAGYVYSGDVAAAAYAAIGGCGAPIQRAVVLGPAHNVPLDTIAASSADAFATPLGLVRTDAEARDRLISAGLVTIDDAAHAAEHSLEVQLPFLQVALGDVALLPLVVGTVATPAVVRVLERLWDDLATLVVVSTDLSHYHDYPTATRLDEQTAAAVVGRRADLLGPESACGIYPLRGLVAFAAARNMCVELLDLCNSGDTAGPRDRVVGYGSFAFRRATNVTANNGGAKVE